MGTLVEVHVEASSHELAMNIDQIVVAEMVRLEQVFSVFNPSSELCRWRDGDVDSGPGPELSHVLALALYWADQSKGAFNPLVGELNKLWIEAEARDVLPLAAQLSSAAQKIQRQRYEMIGGHPNSTGDCSRLNLNALAKGFIVDVARARGLEAGAGVASVCINAGGDLAHSGAGAVQVGIENPHRPYDNEPPLMRLQVRNAALATSANTRRGFRIEGKWYGHVLDPRTGWPAAKIASVTVLAPQAVTADVLATSLLVGSPEEAITCLDSIEGVEGVVVDVDQKLFRSSGWGQFECDLEDRKD